MSLEGSTPLSQNPKGNTAVAISDVNDSSNILQYVKMSIKGMIKLGIIISMRVLGQSPRRRGSVRPRSGLERRLRQSLRRDSLKTVHWTVFACDTGRSLRGRFPPLFFI